MEAKRSGTGGHRFLWPWYRTLDELDSKEGEDRRGPFCLGLKIFFSLKPKLVFYDLSASYFEGDGPEESAGFGNGPDGSGGFREKRLGLAPGGLCSGTGGWSVGPTWAFFGARDMGF